jgi:hypothetical protein
MIIVDYGDLIRPENSRKDEKRHQLETIYEELRGIAQICECPLWTASQTNRSGLNAEVITMESISEAFNKCFVADFIFTVSRTVEDKNTNQGRIFVAKNRNGPDGLVYPLFMDTSNVKIKVLPKTGETANDIIQKSSAERLANLKEKFSRKKEGKINGTIKSNLIRNNGAHEICKILGKAEEKRDLGRACYKEYGHASQEVSRIRTTN